MLFQREILFFEKLCMKILRNVNTPEWYVKIKVMKSVNN